MAGNLRVKEVAVAPGGDGDQGARAVRFVICHNPEQADREAAVRDRLITHLQALIAGSDTWTATRRAELAGSLRAKPGLRRYLRRTRTGYCESTRPRPTARRTWTASARYRTSDLTLTPDDLAAAYKQLLHVERGRRDMKSTLGLRPVYHHRENRIRGHVQLYWLARTHRNRR